MQQRLSDIVEAHEQDLLARPSDFEAEFEAVIILHGLARQIHLQGIALFFFGALKELFDLRFAEFGGQDSVLEAIVIENIRVAGSKDYPKTVIANGPGSMLAAGAAAKIGARQKHRGTFVARKIQHEVRVRLFTGKIAPVIEKDAAKALASQRLQELLRYHLVGVHVYLVDGLNEAGVGFEWLHAARVL